jgi:hypothetical protein
MSEIRKLINLIKINESAVDDQQLVHLKSMVAGKIKELPPDDATIKALREIEDLLRHVNAGGKLGMINGELQKIDDPTVHAAQKDLARYLLSMEMTPEQRDDLFSLWRSDKLVKHSVLTKIGKSDFSKIITNYDKNPAVKEFVNDIMRIAALGQGKGEFGLNVLSKRINKQKGKGDLDIAGRSIEVKTTDGGAGRFTDQEVRPGSGYEKVARELFGLLQPYQKKQTKSGMNLENIIQLVEIMNGNPDMKKEVAHISSLIEKAITLIFSGEDVSKVLSAIKQGNSNLAKQEYAKVSFNYYMNKKNDEGVLYISLVKDPIMTVFFKNSNDLAASGLRLHAGTIYITSVDDVRLPYPQLEIVDTSSAPSFNDDEGGDDIGPIEVPPTPVMKDPEASMSADAISPQSTAEPGPLADRIGRRKRA